MFDARQRAQFLVAAATWSRGEAVRQNEQWNQDASELLRLVVHHSEPAEEQYRLQLMKLYDIDTAPMYQVPGLHSPLDISMQEHAAAGMLGVDLAQFEARLATALGIKVAVTSNVPHYTCADVADTNLTKLELAEVLLRCEQLAPSQNQLQQPLAQTATLEEACQCTVCLDIPVDPVTLACGHSGCMACIIGCLEQPGRMCPMCRKKQPAGGLSINTSMRTMLTCLFSGDERYATRVRRSENIKASQLWSLPQRTLNAQEGQESSLADLDQQAIGASISSLWARLKNWKIVVPESVMLELMGRAGVVGASKEVCDLADEAFTTYVEWALTATEKSGSHPITSRDINMTLAHHRSRPVAVIGCSCSSVGFWSRAIKEVCEQIYPEGFRMDNPALQHVCRQQAAPVIASGLCLDAGALSVVNDLVDCVFFRVLNSSQLGFYGDTGRLSTQQIQSRFRIKDFEVSSDDGDNGIAGVKVQCAVDTQGQEQVLRGSRTLPAPLVPYILGVDAVCAAIARDVGGELLKHGKTEIRKAIDRFTQNPDLEDFNPGAYPGAYPEHPGAFVRQLSPLRVALAASMGVRPVVLTQDAAVALAAFCEYMVAEVLELAGIQTIKAFVDAKMIGGKTAITARCVKVAIDGDEELSTLFNSVVIANGGVSEFIPKPIRVSQEDSQSVETGKEVATQASTMKVAELRRELKQRGLAVDGLKAELAARLSAAVEASQRRTAATGFNSVLCAKIKQSKMLAGVDPRDGRHYRVERGQHLIHCPELDAASVMNQAQRKEAAMRLLSDTERDRLRAESENVKTLHKTRVAEIMSAQKETHLLMPQQSFKVMCARVLLHNDYDCSSGSEKIRKITSEAVRALQVAAEEFLVRRFEHANESMLKGGGCIFPRPLTDTLYDDGDEAACGPVARYCLQKRDFQCKCPLSGAPAL